MAEAWGQHPQDIEKRTTIRTYERWRALAAARRGPRPFGATAPIASNGHYRVTELN